MAIVFAIWFIPILLWSVMSDICSVGFYVRERERAARPWSSYLSMKLPVILSEYDSRENNTPLHLSLHLAPYLQASLHPQPDNMSDTESGRGKERKKERKMQQCRKGWRESVRGSKMNISGSNSIREAQRIKTRKQSLKILVLLIKLYLPQTTHLLCEN